MKQIWKKWFERKSEPVCEETLAIVTDSMETDGRKKSSSLLQRLERFLFGVYEFRFNVLTEQVEFRKIGECVFMQVDQRVLNTFCMEARGRCGRWFQLHLPHLCLEKQRVIPLVAEVYVTFTKCVFIFFESL